MCALYSRECGDITSHSKMLLYLRFEYSHLHRLLMNNVPLHRRIVLLFHSVLADAYAKVDVSTPQAKSRYLSSRINLDSGFL